MRKYLIIAAVVVALLVWRNWTNVGAFLAMGLGDLGLGRRRHDLPPPPPPLPYRGAVAPVAGDGLAPRSDDVLRAAPAPSAPVSSPPVVAPLPRAAPSTVGSGAVGPVTPAAEQPMALLAPLVAQPAPLPQIHVMAGSYGSFSPSVSNALLPGLISLSQVTGHYQ